LNEAKRFKTIAFTGIADILALALAWYAFAVISVGLGLVETVVPPELLVSSSFIHCAYWFVIFAFSGLYKNLYLISRLDEMLKVAKTTVFGVLVLFFLIVGLEILKLDNSNSFYSTLYYWLITFGFMSFNRFVLRTVQRALAIRGRGLHRSLIIGTGQSAFSVFNDLERTKTLGHDVIGFVRVNGKIANGIEQEQILGDMDSLRSLVYQHQVQDVIIALEPEQRDELVKLLSQIEIDDLSIKIVPDFHQVVSGLNKTNQIFGLALIELNTDPMPLWEKAAKRFMDLIIPLVFLIVALPIILLVALLIKLDSSGPIIFAQKRVGRFGKEFMMYKFRTMYQDAEKKTGPVWAQKNDPRITKMGYWLRRLRLDEIPQFINVLRGNMSLVGPRPERKYFVDRFINEIPLYARRLRVRPGITGWAQVKWKYDVTIEDVKEKTKYDLFYVENRSLRMDLKILINTLLVVIKGKGQ
jgi:exopolysaccharide biosynthesis polyprenyl glycosylphosphotransferase